MSNIQALEPQGAKRRRKKNKSKRGGNKFPKGAWQLLEINNLSFSSMTSSMRGISESFSGGKFPGENKDLLPVVERYMIILKYDYLFL